ncbi:U box domain [Macleaya cordata]|uniref:U-box domain-containing protein n=1 Tax=Macleaya cordata TaxID=56857 RepID=A0A200Q9T3_MACCD|nr:U box domain [Macleaya cordata]
MDEVEVPQYFICPISLQIMKDPVTVVTGITYDRESIEQWLSSSTNTSSYCPVTKLPLPKDSDLTPNHTLRRLIQAWCTINASNGVDRIPTPKSPLNKIHVLKLIQELSIPQLQLKSLKKLESLATENERNRKCMIEAGVNKAMVSFIRACFKKEEITGLEEALSVLHIIIRVSIEEFKVLVMENQDFIDSITWVLRHDQIDNHAVVKTHAVSILKSTIEVANVSILQRLKLEFFEAVVQILRENFSHQATKAALHVLLEASPWSRNRLMTIEAGAVLELIELELSTPEKRITELIFGVLDNLCSCADGRAKFLDHAGGIAMVSKRILRVSPTADDLAIRILASICRFSPTNEVLQEMLNVGAVSKLCMVLQADNASNVKESAKLVLRLHSNFWNNSPCIHVYLLTRQIAR